jgi:UDP-glucose 4-epimerase
MKSVVLTGASGYIGQFAVRHLLDKNYIVHAVTSNSANYVKTPNLYWHQANLLNSDETKSLIETIRPTHLLHFAWHIEHGKYWNAVINLDWLQVGLQLAKCFAETGGKRMVVSGTCAEYDWTKPSPFNEYKTLFTARRKVRLV